MQEKSRWQGPWQGWGERDGDSLLGTAALVRVKLLETREETQGDLTLGTPEASLLSCVA